MEDSARRFENCDDVRYTYLREAGVWRQTPDGAKFFRGAPYGVVAYRLVMDDYGTSVEFAYSAARDRHECVYHCGTDRDQHTRIQVDKFDRTIGKKIALGRLQSSNNYRSVVVKSEESRPTNKEILTAIYTCLRSNNSRFPIRVRHTAERWFTTAEIYEAFGALNTLKNAVLGTNNV